MFTVRKTVIFVIKAARIPPSRQINNPDDASRPTNEYDESDCACFPTMYEKSQWPHIITKGLYALLVGAEVIRYHLPYVTGGHNDYS